MVKLLTTSTTSKEAFDCNKFIADMEAHKKFVEEYPFLKCIVDYPSLIKPRNKVPSPEQIRKFDDFIYGLKKKFGTVFDEARTDIENLISNE